MERPEGRFGPLLGWVRVRLGEPLTVERLAERAGMSPRNFARRFAEETGVTPARAMERLRVEAARDRVEGGAAPIDAIATSTGFGDPERMRRAFLRAFGQPPQALRRAARIADRGQASGEARADRIGQGHSLAAHAESATGRARASPLDSGR
jgi:transcriptional regulator GlxA family with amidase domain